MDRGYSPGNPVTAMSAGDIANLSLLANFAQALPENPPQAPQWLRDWRDAARLRFESTGLPSSREEAWRTTNLSALAATAFRPAEHRSVTLSGLASLDLGGPRIVVVDGRVDEGLSLTKNRLPPGLWAGSLRTAAEQAPRWFEAMWRSREADQMSALEALNCALHEDGVLIRVDPETDVETTIGIIHQNGSVGSSTASHARTVICAGARSSLRVVELFVGPNGCTYLVNAVSEIVAGNGARVEHCRIQLDGDTAFHLSNQHSVQGRDSSLLLHNVNLGGKTVRHDIHSRLDGEGADCFLNGLYVTRDNQHVDNQTVLDHLRPRGSSREVYKGILDGDSRGVFSGRIVVRQDAQKTDAKQSNRNLLLSRGALANTRPQLEIYADDVKCTHGATVGRLDEDAVFYLRSRGIDDATARRLMISAFAGEVLEKISQPELSDALGEIVGARLRHARDEACNG